MAVVNATQTLTFAGNAVAAETVVVGGVTYTWRASVTTTANEVLVGATAAASAQNLADAVNLKASGSGVVYGSLTVQNPQVRASSVTATTVVFQARTPGTEGNLIASTETMTVGSFGAGTLTGGSGAIETELRTILDSHQLNASVVNAIRKLAFDPITV